MKIKHFVCLLAFSFVINVQEVNADNIHNKNYKSNNCNYFFENGLEKTIPSEKIYWFDKALSCNPAQDYALFERGSAYLELQLFDKAIADFNKAIEINPDLLDVYIKRATAYMYIQKYNSAISDLNKLVAVFPNEPEILYLRAATYIDIARVLYFKDRDSSITSFVYAFDDLTKIIKLDKNYVKAYDSRMVIYLIFQNVKGFIADSSVSATLETNRYVDYSYEIKKETIKIKNNPNDYKNYLTRAEYYVILNKYSEAKKDFDMAFQLNPSLIQDNYILIETEIYLGNYANAIKYLDKEIKKSNNELVYYFFRGYCYHQLGNYKKAEEDYLKALEIEPSSIATAEALRKLVMDTNKIQ